MSTRIFASYLRSQGAAARQFDAPEIGITTTDDFGNADVIYDQTLPKVSSWGCWWLLVDADWDGCAANCVLQVEELLLGTFHDVCCAK